MIAALKVIFILISIVLTVVVLLQEGKSAGLGVVKGSSYNNSDTYWGKNKGRSAEGTLDKITRILVILFMLIALALNIWK